MRKKQCRKTLKKVTRSFNNCTIAANEFCKTIKKLAKVIEERNNKKKIKYLTLEELHNICEKQHSCQECPLNKLCGRDGSLSNVLARCFYKTNYAEQEIKVAENEIKTSS